MAKSITEKIDKFLVGENESIREEKLDESILEPSEVGIKPGEYNNIATGLRRISFRLQKANTPQKYVDAFEVVQQLVARFPLKAKVVWQAVASEYNIRFGSASAPSEMTGGAGSMGEE